MEHPNSPQAEIYRDLAKSVVSEVAKIRFGKGGKSARPAVSFDKEGHVIRVVGGQGAEEVDESTISPANLRRECRCAACVEELTGKQILNPSSIPESIRPINMSPTGNYALSVDWSDGHRSLYPYRQIRSLIDAKKKGGNSGEVSNVGEGVGSAKETVSL